MPDSRSDPALQSDPTTQDERAVRVQLAAAYRLVAHFGWDDLIFTHLSIRVPGPGHRFLLNPFGWLFHEITASSLVQVDEDGNVLEDPTGQGINPAGFTIHSAIHMAREDARCVMHLHEPACVAVSARKDGLLPLSQTAMACIPQLASHEYEGVVFDLDERKRLVRDLGDNTMLLLHNHGVLTTGHNVAEAFMHLYFLVRACQIQVATGDGPYHLPSRQAVRTAGRQSLEGLPMAAETAWPGLIRLLDTRMPGFRD